MKEYLIISVIAIGLLVSCGNQASQQEATVTNNSKNVNVTVKKERELSSGMVSKIEKWKKEVYKQYPSKRLSPNDFREYDFGPLWQTSWDFGYIGTNFQRMYITFERVKKISNTEYSVKGFSQVKQNVCRFTGTIKNIEYNQLKTFLEECDGNERFLSVENQGFILADFVMNEDETQKGSGVFLGNLMMKWRILSNGELNVSLFDNCLFDESYLFLGEWISYKTNASKPVAWGGEIPYPFGRGVFYDGDGDICINPKYVNNGWEEFYSCSESF
jgi:hypothetical protein